MNVYVLWERGPKTKYSVNQIREGCNEMGLDWMCHFQSCVISIICVAVEV